MADTIIDRFFAAVGSGGEEAIPDLVTPDAIFEAQGPSSVPVYGRLEGRDGVRRFIATLRALFETERFDVRRSTQSDDVAFAYGYMQHRVRRTGQVFRSEWALYCGVRGGRIRTYKIFEDTAALAAAYGCVRGRIGGRSGGFPKRTRGHGAGLEAGLRRGELCRSYLARCRPAQANR